MKEWGDELGLLWQQPIVQGRTKHDKVPTALPPVPETGWVTPSVFPNLSSAKRIAIDVEACDPYLKTKGPGYRRGDAFVCGVSIGTDDGFRGYYPVRHQPGGNLDPDMVFGWLKDELGRPNQTKVGANILYDLDALASDGVEVAGPFDDVLIAEPLLDEESPFGYGLDEVAYRHLNERKVTDELGPWLRRAYGETNWKSNIWRAPVSLVGPYGEGDVDLPLRVSDVQRGLMGAEGLLPLYNLECRLIPQLLRMRQRGIRVDVAKAEQVNARLALRSKELLAEIKREVGFAVDIWSSDSLAKAFRHLSIAYPIIQKTGNPSFTKPWLDKHPSRIAKLVMAGRGSDKFRSTFVEGYILKSNVNGRIHCQFNQMKGDDNGTVTGRLSSSLPNLQNIPTRDDEMGPLIRSMFLPEEGEIFHSIDYKQVEYKLIAASAAALGLTGAHEAAQAFINDPTTDYHVFVSELTGLPRKQAKNLNFGIAYGMGFDALAETLGVTVAEAKSTRAIYDAKVPFVKELSNFYTNQANLNGFIRTLLGRRRRFKMWEVTKRCNGKDEVDLIRSETRPDIKDASRIRRAFTHAAMNAAIQGSAADIIKTAMVRIEEAGLPTPLLTVHDELCFSSNDNRAMAEVRRIMETCVADRIRSKIPLTTDYEVGPNWGELKAA